METQRQHELTPYNEEQGAFTYAYKKAEKLAVALHMVTSFIDRNEPLYLQMRNKGLAVLSQILGLRVLELEHNIAFERAYDSIVSTLMLLDVAYHAGYLSEMNWSILRREYVELGDFIRERKDTFATSGTTLSRSFFRITEQNQKEMRPATDNVLERRSVIKGQQFAERARDNKRHYRSSGRKQEVKNKRRESVMGIVREKGKVTIKDISALISDCSEKTLQRELVSLVQQGVLKRDGERRWSTYSLP